MISIPSDNKGLLIIANFNQDIEIRNFLDKAKTHFPMEHTLVVDDGSTDNSAQIAQELGFNTQYHAKNMGIGAAIRTGIEHAKKNGYQWVLISSSNGKIRPEDFDVLTAPILKNTADYTQGSRFIAGGESPGLTSFRKWAIPVFSVMTSMIMRRIFTDITCGARAYKLSLLDRPDVNLNQQWLERYELEYYIHYKVVKSKARIVEVPVKIIYTHLEKGRKTKIKPFSGWWSMARPFVFLALGLRN